MPKADNYVCPRCEYNTPLKRLMKRHLYEKKNPCSDRTGLELTDEIKERVLINHYYTSTPVSSVSYNVNAYIGSMDTIPKLTRYLEYSGKTVIDINDLVERQHQDVVEGLNGDKFRNPHLITSENFLVLIDNMAKVNNNQHEEMNIMYDDTLDRIKIYCDEEWIPYMLPSGMRRIVEILRSNYLDNYECYLYKKLYIDKDINATQLNNVRLHLKQYYRFLAIFDLYPLVYSEPVENIIFGYQTEDRDEFHDFGMGEYNNEKQNLSKSEINKTKKDVLEIVKRNHKVNLKKLNETVLRLINVDTNFRNTLMQEAS